MQIRRAEAADETALANLRRSAILTLTAPLLSREEAETWATQVAADRMIRAIREHDVWVAVEEAAIGWVEVDQDRVAGLYVSPSYACRGVGSALLAFAETHMRSARYVTAYLNSSPNALAFYLRRGYLRCGPAAAGGAYPLRKDLAAVPDPMRNESASENSKTGQESPASGKSMRVIKGILFDFFGTLVEYSSSRVEQGYYATHQLLVDNGVDIAYTTFLDSWVAASQTLDQWSRETGREYSMQQAAVEFLTRVSPHQAQSPLATHLWESYVNEWSVAIRYIPGLQELIAELSLQFHLGVVTNTHHAPLIHRHLQAMGVAPYMKVVMTSIEYGRPKPDPGIFAAALERLGCRAESTLFVGDSYAADYLGAKSAGMHACLIDPGGTADALPHEVIQSVLEVRAHLEVRTHIL